MRWRRDAKLVLMLTMCTALAGCGDDSDDGSPNQTSNNATNNAPNNTENNTPNNVDVSACDAEPVIRTTGEGVEFVRTPDRLL